MNHDNYQAGHDTAEYTAPVSVGVIARLKRDADYWQGFHDGRPLVRSGTVGCWRTPRGRRMVRR